MRTELPPRCVYDASVLIKYVAPERGSHELRELLENMFESDGFVLYVPDLLYIECANILWKKVQRGEINAATGTSRVDELSALGLITTPLKQLNKRALQLACELNISAYDAAYVALAEQKSVPLLTADMALARKLLGTQHMVITLEEYLPTAQ